MADHVIADLRGGYNPSDSPAAVRDDQIVDGANVEWRESTVGERRRGATEEDTSATDLDGADRITFLHRHLPESNPGAAELWALGTLGIDPDIISYLVQMADADTTITPVDEIDVTGVYQYQVAAVSLHGKMFIAYKSEEDRLHVWDGTTLRRVGLAQPDPPTLADEGAGTYAGTRFFRVRVTEQDGSGDTLRRSEPSTEVSISPSGTGAGVTITQPAALPDEGETHWEVEASLDGTTFYVIATVVIATTTYDDEIDYDTGYSSFDLSPTIGEYTVPYSARYLAADEDRLLVGGSFEDENLASRVSWTVVGGDITGDGNDERIPLESVNFLDLDGLEGGPLRGISYPVNGYTYAFKDSHIYKLVRTGIRVHAYDHFPLTKSVGGMEGSITVGKDERGKAAVFFTDIAVGPHLIGASGLQQCGDDIRVIWERVNQEATVPVRTLYYVAARQLHLWLALDGADTPNTRMVLHTNHMKLGERGYVGGWTPPWTGSSCEALAAVLFSNNFADRATEARSRTLVPFVGLATDL